MRRPTCIAVAAALVASVLLAPTSTSARPTGARDALPTLSPLSTSADHRIVDAKGRDIILRGANVNSLGEYWQGDPTTAPTMPITEADWAEMESRGLDVVRLLVTWSKVEPTKGTIDQAYLDEVDTQVKAAAAHGIYTVIDMHQDAYTATVWTHAPETCPAGTHAHKGWDGAPAWATITDGLSTCETNERNDPPAILAAWNHLWDDTDGIATELANAWKAIATRFNGRPEVAGYDLLNEPEASQPAAVVGPKYNAFLKRIIDGIRSVEASAPFEHLLLVEPALPSAVGSNGIVIPDPKAAGVDTRNIVASVHNYAESIGTPGFDFTIESLNTLIQTVAHNLGVATWGGEYGFWDTAPATLAKLDRYAADEDRLFLGSAWWQWRQSCGDPHSISWDGTTATVNGDSTHLHKLGCPGNVDDGTTEEFMRVLGRAYPRATPGRITHLTSDWRTGAFEVQADATQPGGQLVVWTPTAADADHTVSTYGLRDVHESVVGSGRIITATVTAAGHYALRIGDPTLEQPSTTTTTTVPADAPAAEPVDTTADFTG